jgi:ribosomal protein S18 acetylase RimI-like enzyme
MTVNPLSFRHAQAEDSDIAHVLIYSSGTAAFEYGFSWGKYQARQFLAFAFTDGHGFFGWRNHIVAILEDKVVGIGAFYNGDDYLRLSIGLIKQILQFYPLHIVPQVFWHSLQLQSLMPKPSQDMHYVANFAVHADKRGQKIATAMLDKQYTVAQQLGRKIYALDVAVDNPRAQLLYERLGFHSVKKQKFAGKSSCVADTLRMERRIV